MQKQSSPANVHGFEECAELVASAITDLRNVAYLLHPPLMDEVGLSSVVPEYVRGFEKRSGVRVHVDGSEEVGRLDDNREMTLSELFKRVSAISIAIPAAP
jgi:signal transduction histidine kinase